MHFVYDVYEMCAVFSSFWILWQHLSMQHILWDRPGKSSSIKRWKWSSKRTLNHAYAQVDLWDRFYAHNTFVVYRQANNKHKHTHVKIHTQPIASQPTKPHHGHHHHHHYHHRHKQRQNENERQKSQHTQNA